MIDTWCNINRMMESPPIPGIKIINYDKRNIIGKCHNYSLFHIFSENNDINKSPEDFLRFCSNISFNNAIIIINVLFKKTNNPQHGDLVSYKDNYGFDTHFGIYTKYTHYPKSYFEVESKWGGHPEILQHVPTNVPSVYGNNVSFYALKNKNSGTKSNASILRSAHNYAKHVTFITGVGVYIIWLPLIIGFIIRSR